MRYPDASIFQGMILWAAGTQGPLAPPGAYNVRLTVNGKTVGTEAFRLIPDPRSKGVAAADYAEQFALLIKIRDRFTETNDAVKTIGTSSVSSTIVARRSPPIVRRTSVRRR
jgi:hypothetical protein